MTTAAVKHRLPPHGKQFADARARGLTPRKLGLGHLLVLFDWQEPPACMPFITILPDTDLGMVNLSFVAGLHVSINHTDLQAHRVQAVIDALFSAGAVRVEAINRDALARGEDVDAAWPVFEREALRHAA